MRARQRRQRRRRQPAPRGGGDRPADRVVCILTGHQLKDPTATVAYHGTDQENFEKVLGSRGVRRAGFANRPVVVANDLDDIIRTIALSSPRPRRTRDRTRGLNHCPGGFPQLPRCDRSELASGGSLI